MTQELKGTVTANIRKYEAHADSVNDGKTASVEFQIALNEEQAEALGGAEFKRACFAGYVGRSGERVYDSVKIGGHLAVKAEHTLAVDEKHTLVAKPKLGTCDLEDGRIVKLKLTLAVPGSSKILRKYLDEKAGDDVTLEFKGVTQTDIEEAASTKSRGKKAGAAAGNGHDVDEDGAGAEAGA